MDTRAPQLLQRATLTSSDPEFAAICEKLYVYLLQTITCPIINLPQLSRLLFLWARLLFHPYAGFPSGTSLLPFGMWLLLLVRQHVCLGAAGLFTWPF